MNEFEIKLLKKELNHFGLVGVVNTDNCDKYNTKMTQVFYWYKTILVEVAVEFDDPKKGISPYTQKKEKIIEAIQGYNEGLEIVYFSAEYVSKFEGFDILGEIEYMMKTLINSIINIGFIEDFARDSLFKDIKRKTINKLDEGKVYPVRLYEEYLQKSNIDIQLLEKYLEKYINKTTANQIKEKEEVK